MFKVQTFLSSSTVQSQKSFECLLHWKFKCWGVMLCHGHVAFNVWRNVLPSSSSSSTLLGLRHLKHKVTVIPRPLTLCHIPELYLQQHHCENLKSHICPSRTQTISIRSVLILLSHPCLGVRFTVKVLRKCLASHAFYVFTISSCFT